ncbi:MAG: hypothetical protein KIH69_006290 [Anaerolineae bacterium]|nr:hypothetical protein [Anaerolineae bacterium]
MANPISSTEPSQAPIYQIKLEGHLGQHWSDWFEGMSISPEDDGNTVLTGPVADQAALHGLFKKIRDLGLPLFSVNRISPR